MDFKSIYENRILLLESIQSIVNLGFPKIIADLLFQKFQKNSFLIARWYKEYNTNYNNKDDPNWWNAKYSPAISSQNSIQDLIKMYIASDSKEAYLKLMKDYFEIDVNPDEVDQYYLQEQKKELKTQIEHDFFKEYLFRYKTIIKDIMEGRLKDVSPYKNLSISDAVKKYDERRIFKEKTPLKTYENGWMWINVGPKCELVGQYMNNCGSTGVMSLDKDSTIIALFDTNHKPHVLVTYSPNEKRISGDQSSGSIPVKDEYHDYVLDLADTLDVRFDAQRSASTGLKIKYILKKKIGDKLKKLERIIPEDTWNEYYKITLNNKKIYYTDGRSVISRDDLLKLKDYKFRYKTGRGIKGLIKAALNTNNSSDDLNTVSGVKFYWLEDFNG